MLEEFESAHEIAEVSDRLLKQANALGRLPTPVADIIVAARLREADQNLLAPSLLASAPAHLRTVLARIGNRVKAAVDLREREIFLSPETEGSPAMPFKKLHEVAHASLPWQTELAYADDSLSLSAETRELFEQEANQTAAELLFQREFFRQMASDYQIGIGAVKELADRFGASYRSTLRRFAETHRAPVAAVVLSASPLGAEPLRYKRFEWVASAAWQQRFGPSPPPALMDQGAFPLLEVVEFSRASAFAVGGDSCWKDADGVAVSVRVDVMSNHYRRLGLLWVPQREILKRRGNWPAITKPRVVSA